MRLTHWLRLFAVRLGRNQRRVSGGAGGRRPAGRSQVLSFERLEYRTLLAAPNPFEPGRLLAARTGSD